MLAGKHVLGRAVRVRVLVAPQPGELGADAAPRLAAEQIRELDRAPARLGVLVQQPPRPSAGGRHGEQLGSHVDQAEQHGLAVLELGAEAHHRMEDAAGQPPRPAGDVAHVTRQRSELAVAGPEAPSQPARRIPAGVEQPRAHEPREPLAQRPAREHHVPRHFEVLIQRLAGDEQVHDLARALEDQVDAEIAHDALDGVGLLAAGPQRVGGLVAAAAADLHRVVDDPPPALGVVQLGDCGLEADVVAAAVGHGPAQLGDGFHGERVRGHGADLLRDGVVLADLAAPLHALVRPVADDLETALAHGHGPDGKREPPRVEGDQGQLQPLALAPQHVLLRHAHVGEADHAVVHRLDAHEVAAVRDNHPGRVRLHDERRDLPLFFAGDDLRGGPRHDDQQLGDGPVRAPQLLAVQYPRLPVLARYRRRLHRRGIGADVRLGQRERRHGAPGEPRQILFLLGFAPEHLERLRHADGLVCREQRRQRSVHARDQLHRLHVRQLGETEPAILARDLDAERPHRLECLDDLAGDLALAVDAIGVDLLHQARQAVEERFGAGDFSGILLGIGMDEVEAQGAEEQVANEAGRGPPRLARRFRDIARLGGTHGTLGFGGGGHAGNLTALTVPRSEGDSARSDGGTPMRRSTLLGGVLALRALSLAAQGAPPAPRPQPILIKAGHLIDGRGDQAQANVGILIDGDRIRAVGPLAQVQAQAPNARVIDLSQMTVLPGFIDTHTHLLLQGDPTSESYDAQLLYQSIPYRAILAARNARLALEHGFTALRDLETEGAMYADVDIRNAINRGEIPGPHVFASTRAMAPTGMYPLVLGNWELDGPHGVQPVDGVDGARLAVREQVSHGADWIKYYSDRRYYFTPDSVLHSWVNFTDDEARAIVDEAHRLGRHVAAHAIGSDGIAAALRAGVNSIEHGDGLTDSLMDVL